MSWKMMLMGVGLIATLAYMSHSSPGHCWGNCLGNMCSSQAGCASGCVCVDVGEPMGRCVDTK